jgi:hypothetical protein
MQAQPVGVLEVIRTPDLSLRRQLFKPVKIPAKRGLAKQFINIYYSFITIIYCSN